MVNGMRQGALFQAAGFLGRWCNNALAFYAAQRS
jgi:hypothetical protein